MSTYLYHFAHPSPGPLGKTLGAHHGLEIAYVMDNLQLAPAPSRTHVDDSIRDTLVRYWVRFASTGNPNQEGLPPWPAYEAAGDRCLLVQDTISATQGLRKAKLDAIDALIDAWRSETGMSAGDPRAAQSAPKPSAQQPAGSVVRTVPTPPATKAPSPPVAPHVDTASATTHSVPKPTAQQPASSVVRTTPTPPTTKEPNPPAMPRVAAASAITQTAPQPTAQKSASSVVRTLATPPRAKAPSSPAAPHVNATSTITQSAAKPSAQKPASSVPTAVPTSSKATRPPVQPLDVVSAPGSATETARKMSPPQPPRTSPEPPRSLQHVDAGTVPSTATTAVNSMPPIVDRPITRTGDTRPDENALNATKTASRSHDAQRPLSESRFVTPELGPVKPETYDPHARIDFENARYWIERKHKDWARGLLLRFIIDHPDSEQGETAKRMLNELDK
jgi:hypothetical protein